MGVTVGCCSDVGRVRTINEDSVGLRTFGADGPVLIVVADGIGGGRHGDAASASAVRTIEDAVARSIGASPDDLADERASALLAAALTEANAAVRRLARDLGAPGGAGATCEAALVWQGRCVLRHVGDSRSYLLSDGRLTQLTHDHACVQELPRRRRSRFGDDAEPRLGLVLTRALGLSTAVETDERRLTLARGDTLLLCTDGLTAMLADREIETILGAEADAQAASEALVREANVRGGVDNATAVVVRCEGFEPRGLGQRGAAACGHRATRRAGFLGSLLVLAAAVGILLWFMLRGWAGERGGPMGRSAAATGGQAR